MAKNQREFEWLELTQTEPYRSSLDNCSTNAVYLFTWVIYLVIFKSLEGEQSAVLAKWARRPDLKGGD